MQNIEAYGTRSDLDDPGFSDAEGMQNCIVFCRHHATRDLVVLRTNLTLV